jgi:hypothetical protein
MTNRRQFLSGCSTIAIAAAVSPTVLSAASFACGDDASAQLTCATFAKFLGSSFLVRREKEPKVDLELTHVRERSTSHLDRPNAFDARHEKFSLEFRGPQSAPLPQNTYSFEHRQLGRFEMFIVPVGVKDETHGYYQAVFNRLAAA